MDNEWDPWQKLLLSSKRYMVEPGCIYVRRVSRKHADSWCEAGNPALQGVQVLSRGNGPQLHEPVAGNGQRELAVGRELGRAHDVLVTLQRVHALPRDSRPNLCRP